MFRSSSYRSWMSLATGAAFGLAIAGALGLGVYWGQQTAASPALPGLEELRLRAMASHGSDNFAIATGPVDEEVEGLFTLDFVTGDLQCFVINPRTVGLGGWFKANVAADLGVERGKKPHYLIATGNFTAPGAAGNQRPAASLCYVVDANTGDAVCYTFPWARSATAVGVTQVTPMIPVHKWKTRSVAIRGK